MVKFWNRVFSTAMWLLIFNSSFFMFSPFLLSAWISTTLLL
jgi:hypothetical protein